MDGTLASVYCMEICREKGGEKERGDREGEERERERGERERELARSLIKSESKVQDCSWTGAL
jgi:hypothetical protein